MEHSSLFIINNMNCGLMKNELSTASDEARLWGKGVCVPNFMLTKNDVNILASSMSFLTISFFLTAYVEQTRFLLVFIATQPLQSTRSVVHSNRVCVGVT